MKKTAILIGIFCVCVIGIVCLENCNSVSQYREYTPKIFNGNQIVEAPEMLTQKHQQNVINVLKYYDEDWKLENGELLVSKKIDEELLWNYTTKANDSIWLIQHQTKD